MKKISILILTVFLFAGCNNVDEILSNFKNLIPSQDTKGETEIKEEPITNEKENENYQYEDICDLFFNDPEAIEDILSSGEEEDNKFVHITINAADQIMCNGNFGEESVYEAVDIALRTVGAPVFLIHSEGSRETDQKILTYITKRRGNELAGENERFICLMRDEVLQRWKEEMEIKPPPPPPPPPEIIEIVELDVEIEDEIEIEDTETDEDETIYIEEEDDEEVFMVVENMPLFQGCSDSECTTKEIMKFIMKNVKYPPLAKEYNITGKVFVQCVIEKDGSVGDVKLLRGVDKSLDKEALRVVSSMPNFTPGTQYGKPVRVYFTFPINFTLN